MLNKNATSCFDFVINKVRLSKSKRSTSPLKQDYLKRIIPCSKRSTSPLKQDYLKRIIPCSKRSQSQIISTVLLILLVFAAATIIFGFVIPFIKNELSKSDCLDVVSEIEIKSNPDYTCWDANIIGTRVQIHIGNNESIKGFMIELGGASSKSFEITEGEHSGVVMYRGGDFEIPGKNEERTYVINDAIITTAPDSITIYSILKNDKICGKSDVLTSVITCIPIVP